MVGILRSEYKYVFYKQYAWVIDKEWCRSGDNIGPRFQGQHNFQKWKYLDSGLGGRKSALKQN